MLAHVKSSAQMQNGVFADCQYCNCETKGNRYYKNSLEKLDNCISTFNKHNLEFLVGLGDLIDKDFDSFEKVNSVLKSSKYKIHHVIGNHDYSVDKKYYKEVPHQLELKKTYYSFSKKNWQFIFLNGNEITLQSHDQKIIKEAELLIEQLTQSNLPNKVDWNGAISDKQLKWLQKELKRADKNNRNVILFCHYPIYPHGVHTLWNADKIIPILAEHNCIKAWINGHNHKGDYYYNGKIHFLTMNGMVDTEKENAYSILKLHDNKIEIKGFGRVKSRTLPLE